MKTSRKHIITAFLLTASLALFAQKQSKNFKETFNVKKGAIVELNASHADIDVSTWGKNQVLVEATIEIDGLTKEEAQKYFKDFKFEALGNSSKVRIDVGGNSFNFGDNEFIIFNPENIVIPEINIPEIDIPEFDFKMPEINIPEIDFEMPDIDLEKFIIDLDSIEFDFEKYTKDGKDYFFRWKDDVRDITIKNKKEWEKFKKTKEYKEWKKEMKENKEKMKEEMRKGLKEAQKELKGIDLSKLIGESLKIAEQALVNVDMEGIINESLQEANKALKEIDREKIRKELSEVRREFRRSYRSDRVYDNGEDELIINDKKVKITKKITVKVPKGVILDLNTRHCKLKLPKMSASGKVSYGSFNSGGLDGGELNINYAPVQISSVANTTLNLKNVTDAKLVSVTQSTLNSDSSGLEIAELFSGTTIDASFGDVKIKKVNPTLKDFSMILNQADATINLQGFGKKLKVYHANTVVTDDPVRHGGKGMTLIGTIEVSTSGDEVKIKGKYSELTIKQ
jgi:hypothetical protein